MPAGDVVRNLLIALQVNAEGVSKGIKVAQNEFAGLQKSLDATATKFTAIGAGLTAGVTIPIAGAATAAFKFSKDFNAALANIQSLDVPRARVEQLRGAIQQLAVDTGKSTADIAAGTYQVISAFGDTADTVKILETNAKAASAGLATTEQAIALTSAVTKAYGDTSAAAVRQAADLAQQTVILGQTTFPELASAMGNVTGVASQLGVSQKELFAGFATLTGVSGDAARVSTQLAGALQGLSNPSEELAKTFERLGVSSGKALIEQRGLQGALQAVANDANQTGIPLAKLLGNVEGLRAVIPLTTTQAETFTEKLGKMGDAAGTVDRAFKAQTEGVNALGFTFDQFLVRLEVVAQRLGDALAPAFGIALDAAEPLIGALETAVEIFASMPKPVQAAGIAIAGIAAAAGPTLTSLGFLADAVSSVIDILPTLTSAMGKVSDGGITLAGSLDKGKAAVVGIGKAAVVAAAAFAAWKLGEWAAQNIPLVQKLGDIIVAFPLALFEDSITGVSEAQANLGRDLTALSKDLEKVGIKVERGSLTLLEWGRALREAAKDAHTHRTAAGQLVGPVQQVDKASDAAAVAVRKFEEALKGSKAAADKLPQPLRYAQAEVKELAKNGEVLEERTRRLARQMEDLRTRELERAAEVYPRITSAMRESMQAVFDMTGALNTQQAVFEEGTRDALALEGAYRTVGITSETVARDKLDAMRRAVDDIRRAVEEGRAPQEDLNAAIEAYNKAAGKGTQSTGIWGDALKQVSTVITDLGRSVAQDLGKHIQTGIGFIDSMTEALLRMVSERVFGAVIKNFQSLKDFIPSLESIRDIFSDIKDSLLATGSEAIPSPGGGAPAPGGGGGGGAAGGAGGFFQVFNAITGFATAVGSIGSFIKSFEIETGLDAIELNTRQIKEVLDGSRGSDDLGIIGALFSISETLQFGTFVKVLEQIRDDVRNTIAPAMAQITASGVMVAGLAQVAATAGTIAQNTETTATATTTTAENTAQLPELPGALALRSRGAPQPTGAAPEPTGTPGQVAGRTRFPLPELPQIEPPETDPNIEELRRRNPLAFESENPLASILLGGRNPFDLQPVVSAIDTGALENSTAIFDLNEVFRARGDRANFTLDQINTNIAAGAARPLEFHAHLEGATFTDEAQSRRTIDYMFSRARTWGKGIS